ncbi:hypothetical protein DFH08DRAFT_813325 [Mycena albidolilacea]|uniref:Uncharacterized protein n=1 Tax=Mycena albidolilacea TaxID=1033008 RepID=A0AAD7EKX2_9AGAR|nr:hypothetical protein DFH08DRAFT_813325 [Mycena albidolilacea]
MVAWRNATGMQNIGQWQGGADTMGEHWRWEVGTSTPVRDSGRGTGPAGYGKWGRAGRGHGGRDRMGSTLAAHSERAQQRHGDRKGHAHRVKAAEKVWFCEFFWWVGDLEVKKIQKHLLSHGGRLLGEEEDFVRYF